MEETEGPKQRDPGAALENAFPKLQNSELESERLRRRRRRRRRMASLVSSRKTSARSKRGNQKCRKYCHFLKNLTRRKNRIKICWCCLEFKNADMCERNGFHAFACARENASNEFIGGKQSEEMRLKRRLRIETESGRTRLWAERLRSESRRSAALEKGFLCSGSWSVCSEGSGDVRGCLVLSRFRASVRAGGSGRSAVRV